MLPRKILNAPKRGFGVPLGRWLREDLAGPLRETLLDEGLARKRVFRKEALAGLIEEHVSGRGDHRHRLWALLVLARWLGKHA
jgi:asparagine synthase (glutamine-hydrolysing)